MKRKIVLFGLQGSGKGTQANLSSTEFKIPHISTGDIFRDNIKNKTELGQKVENLINQGILATDEITNQIVKDRLEKDDCSNGFILDGFPRNMNQAEFLDNFLNIDLALEIWITDEEAIKRISMRRVCSECGAGYHLEHNIPQKEGLCDKCGGTLVVRDDDKEDSIKKRLATYHEQTEEIIDHYKEKGLYKRVDGTNSIAAVNNEVFKIIKE